MDHKFIKGGLLKRQGVTRLDELIFQVREDCDIGYYAKLIKNEMENPPLLRDFGVKLKVPLVSGLNIGRNLAEMEDMKI